MHREHPKAETGRKWVQVTLIRNFGSSRPACGYETLRLALSYTKSTIALPIGHIRKRLGATDPNLKFWL